MSIYRKADFQPNYTDYLDAAGRMIDQRYAKFAVTTLSDEEVSGLSLATMAMPENSIGYQAYITWVSGTDAYVHELLEWGYGLAKAVAYSKHKAKDGHRRRTLVEGFREDWGRAAVKDAYSMVMADEPVATAYNRRLEFGVRDESYQLVRDFVAASIAHSIKQFKFALEWAWGYRDDKLFGKKFNELRLKCGGNGVGDSVFMDEQRKSTVSSHYAVTGGAQITTTQSIMTKDSYTRFGVSSSWRDPFTLYPATGANVVSEGEQYSGQELVKAEIGGEYIAGGPVLEFHGAEAEAYILANPSQPSSGATDR